MRTIVVIPIMLTTFVLSAVDHSPEALPEDMPSLQQAEELLQKAKARVKEVEAKIPREEGDEKKRYQATVNYERSMLDNYQGLVLNLPKRDALLKRIDEYVSLEIDAPLLQAIGKFKESTGVEIRVGRYIPDKAVKVSSKRIRIRDAIWSIAQQAHASWSVGMGTIGLAPLAIPADAWKQDLELKIARRASLDLIDTAFVDAINFVQQLLNASLIVDPAIPAERSINLRVKDMTLNEILQWIARGAQARVSFIDHAIYIHPDGPIPPGMKGTISESDARLLNRRVTFEFADTPLEEGIGFLAQLTKANLVVGAKAKRAAKVTLRVQDMPLDAALTWICRLSSCVWEIKDGTIYFDDAPAASAPVGAPAKARDGTQARLRVKTSDGTEFEADSALLQEHPELAARLAAIVSDPVKDGVLSHMLEKDENSADISALITKAAPTAKYQEDEKLRILLITAQEEVDLRRAAAVLRSYNLQRASRKAEFQGKPAR